MTRGDLIKTISSTDSLDVVKKKRKLEDVEANGGLNGQEHISVEDTLTKRNALIGYVYNILCVGEYSTLFFDKQH